MVQDVPRAAVVFRGVGTDEVVVELVRDALARKSEWLEKVSRSKNSSSMSRCVGLHVAVVGVDGGRDADVVGCVAQGSEHRTGGGVVENWYWP